jgi:hypothetical protein
MKLVRESLNESFESNEEIQKLFNEYKDAETFDDILKKLKYSQNSSFFWALSPEKQRNVIKKLYTYYTRYQEKKI